MLIDKFSKTYYSTKQSGNKRLLTVLSPQHIAAIYGKSQLCKYFVGRTNEVNPKEAYS